MSSQPCIMLCMSRDDRQQGLGFAFSREELASYPWITVLSDARVARDRLKAESRYREVWVASSNEVEGVNLAAAVKADAPWRAVYLVARSDPKTVMPQVRAAGLDGVMSVQELVWRCETYGVRQESGAPNQRVEQRGERRANATHEPSTRASPPQTQLSKEKPMSGFLMTVVSGSGGTGKSTVATLAAYASARCGLRTALLDGDFQFGDLSYLSGASVVVPVEHLLECSSCLEDVAKDLAGEPVLIAAPRRLETAEVAEKHTGQLVQDLVRCFDVVIVNTGSAWGEQHASLLELSASILFLVDQRVSSVRSCRHALDLCLRCGIATNSFLFALNRCSKQAPFSPADVSGALHGAHVVELRDGGSEIEELMGSGLTKTLAQGSNPLCESIDRVLSETLPSSAVKKPVAVSEQKTARSRQGVPFSLPRKSQRRRGGKTGDSFKIERGPVVRAKTALRQGELS